jgi:hypothetical protein
MNDHTEVNPPKIASCPHCGNLVPHYLKQTEPEATGESGDGDFYVDKGWYAVLMCKACSKPSVFVDFWDEPGKKWVPQLVYPIPLGAPEEVPKEIRKVFDEAVSVLHRSPNLCAVGLRKSLEGICNNQKAVGATLSDKIKSLSSRGIIPKALSEMMETSRLFGNIGVRFGESDISLDEATSFVQFVMAIFEYVYVAPAKINAAIKSLQKTP